MCVGLILRGFFRYLSTPAGPGPHDADFPETEIIGNKTAFFTAEIGENRGEIEQNRCNEENPCIF